MIWKILYSPYDLAGLVVMLIGLAIHVVLDYRQKGP